MFFRGFQRLDVFFELGFHSDCIPPKRECSLMKTGVIFLAGRKQITSSQSMCIQDNLFAIAISRNFDSGTSMACLVRKQDDLLLLNTWDGQLLFCS